MGGSEHSTCGTAVSKNLEYECVNDLSKQRRLGPPLRAVWGYMLGFR
jgi:hypothetical protein